MAPTIPPPPTSGSSCVHTTIFRHSKLSIGVEVLLVNINTQSTMTGHGVKILAQKMVGVEIYHYNCGNVRQLGPSFEFTQN